MDFDMDTINITSTTNDVDDDDDNIDQRTPMLCNRVIHAAVAVKDWRLFNVILLGTSFLLLFTPFQTCSMVQTLVLEGAKLELNDTDGSRVGNGYTSLSLIYGVFAASIWFAPSFVYIFGPKWSLMIGASTYCSVDSTCLLFGNLVVYFLFANQRVIFAGTRTVLYIILTTISVAGVLSMLLFSNRPSGDGSSIFPVAEKPNLIEEFKSSWRLLATKEMALLVGTFAYSGIELCFWSSVFITSVGHLSDISSAKQLTGLCGILIGSGEIIGGALFGILGNFSLMKQPGRDTVILVGYVTHMLAFYGIFVTFPADSPLQESTLQPYFSSSPYVAGVCAFFIGFGDSCYHTQMYPIIVALFRTNSAAAFAFQKFVQSLSTTISFTYSHFLQMQSQLAVLVVTATLGTIMFFMAERFAVQKAAENRLTAQTTSTLQTTL